MSWQPLPPRKKTRRDNALYSTTTANTADVHETSNGPSDENARITSNFDDDDNESNSSARAMTTSINHGLVRDNVLARSKIIRAEATLESQDGVAGEFYECK